MQKVFKLVFVLILWTGFSHGYGQDATSGQNLLTKKVSERKVALFELYRHLHENPEISLQEKNTAKRMAKELRSSGFEVHANIGGNGVVGVLKNGEGPCLLIRTDMDALPIREETGVNYRSQVVQVNKGQTVGVMHGCGHDVHMTTFVGTAQVMHSLKDKWSGTLLMVAQPAEEISLGAKMMISEWALPAIFAARFCFSSSCRCRASKWVHRVYRGSV